MLAMYALDGMKPSVVGISKSFHSWTIIQRIRCVACPAKEVSGIVVAILFSGGHLGLKPPMSDRCSERGETAKEKTVIHHVKASAACAERTFWC